MRNNSLQFRCEWIHLRRDRGHSPWIESIAEGDVLRVPISHGEGNYFADAETLDLLEQDARVAFRYCDSAGNITSESNPNGSARNIAGIVNARGNVLGMMPHPERAGEQLVGGIDGNRIWASLIESALAVTA